MKKFISGLLIGTLSTVSYFIYQDREVVQEPDTYWVKSINSHTPNENGNQAADILVYMKGKSGHTKEMQCVLPPDLKLEGNNETGWTGIKRIKITGIEGTYMFGVSRFYALKLE